MPPDNAKSQTAPAPIPRVGMLATVRNRRGLVAAVEPFDAGPEGRLHLTTVEYLDADGQALEDHLVWEREPGARLLEPTSPPGRARGRADAANYAGLILSVYSCLVGRPIP